MHRLSYSSRGSIVIECAIPAVQTTVELCRTKTVLFGSGGPVLNHDIFSINSLNKKKKFEVDFYLIKVSRNKLFIANFYCNGIFSISV